MSDRASRWPDARVARLATVDSEGRPHVVPICFAVDGDKLYTAVDEKPKRTRRLRRLENIEANPAVEVLIDHYEEDWSRLRWVRLRGRARVTDLHERALELLQAKYEQYRAAPPAGPLIEIAVAERIEWPATTTDRTKEATMAVLMMAEIPGGTSAMYDEVNRMIGISPVRLPDGLISHQAGTTDEGFLIVDVWESPEAFERFLGEQAEPVLEQVGVPPVEPRFFPVHNLIEKGQGDDPRVMLIFEVEGFGPEAYDALTATMPAHQGDGSNHPSVTHIAALKNGGLIVVDVWDSPESFERLAKEQLAGAAEGGDLPRLEPRVVPIHNRFARP